MRFVLSFFDPCPNMEPCNCYFLCTSPIGDFEIANLPAFIFTLICVLPFPNTVKNPKIMPWNMLFVLMTLTSAYVSIPTNYHTHTHTHLHIPESKATTVITHKEWERSPLVPINRKPWKPLWFVTFGTSPQLISPSPAIPLLSFQSHNRAEVRRRCHLVDIHGT